MMSKSICSHHADLREQLAVLLILAIAIGLRAMFIGHWW